MLSAVSEFTRLNINEVYAMPAADFFMYIEFINIRNRKEYMRQQKEIAEIKAMNRRRR